MRRFVIVLFASLTFAPLCLAQTTAGVAGNPSEQIDAGRYREALQSLAPLLQDKPYDAQLLYLHGRAEFALKRYAEAVDNFRAATQKTPDNGLYLFYLGQALTQYIPHAGLVSRLSLAKELRAAYEKSVALRPDLIPAREALLDFYLRAPGFFGGSEDEAEAQAAAIARIDPSRGARAQAVIAVAHDHPESALAAYAEAIRLAPADTGLHLDLGEYLLKLNRAHQACDEFRRVLTLAPDQVEALEQMAQAAVGSGRRDDLHSGMQALQRLETGSLEGLTLSTDRIKALMAQTRSLLLKDAR